MTASETVTTSSSTIADISNGDVLTSQKRQGFAEMESVIESFAGLDNEVKMRIGHQFGDFILDCQFSGVTCTSR